MGKRWIALFCLAVALSVPPAASAAEAESGGTVLFQLSGSHGYSIFVIGGADGEPGSSSGTVAVLVTKGDTGAIYSAPATVTGSRFEADLGPYGQISLTPEATGTTREAPGSCGGKPAGYEGVDYVGEFRFRGDRGFTSARAKRLPLRVDLGARLVCGGSIEETVSGPGLPGAILVARSSTGSGRLTVTAETNGPRRPVKVRAVLDETRGSVRVEREVSEVFPSGAIGYDPKLQTAALDPPAPFSGTARFARGAARSNRWTGDLRVDLPGRPGTSLTGHHFSAYLIHGRWEHKTIHDRLRANRSTRTGRLNPLPWLLTRPSPTASATSLLLGPS